MAEVVPFKGVRYNPELISNMGALVAPPYDVIAPEEQDALYMRDPHNVIRLILGKHQPGDNAEDNVHTRAGRYLRDWMEKRILVSDPAPCYYLTSVSFSYDGGHHTRYGLIARVRLEPFEKGIVLPHERTFSKVKTERLMLMKACHANLSPVFGLYTGEDDLMERFNRIADTPPLVDLTDDKGHQHRMWCLSHSEIVNHLVSYFNDKKIYIADGHHRYETALNYRNWILSKRPDLPSDDPVNFIMMSLSSMTDPGMVILPAHRLLKEVSDDETAALAAKAEEYFDITIVPMDKGMEDALDQFSAMLQSRSDRHAVGVYSRNLSLLQIWTLKEGVMERLFGDQIPAALRDLDVTILTHAIMMELMGFDQQRLDDETKITYRTTVRDAVQAVHDGAAQLGFILNPTRIEQVLRVSEKGLTMPRKSTYFYPKVLSGLVYHLLQ